RARTIVQRLGELPLAPLDALRPILNASERPGLEDVHGWAVEAAERAAREESLIAATAEAGADDATARSTRASAPTEWAIDVENGGGLPNLPPAVAAVLEAVEDVERRRAQGDRTGLTRAVAQ